MNNLDIVTFIIQKVVPTFFIAIGCVGNVLVFYIFTRNSRRQMSAYFRFMAITDTLNLIQIMNVFFPKNDSSNFRLISRFFCKFFNYFWYVFRPVSSWILIIMSIDRFLAIFYSKNSKYLKKINFQLLLCFVSTALNCVFYIIVIFTYDLVVDLNEMNVSNFTLNQKICHFIDFKKQHIVSILDLINSSVVPFFLLTVVSILMIYSIYRLRSRSLLNKLPVIRKFKKDMQYAITSIVLNIIFLILNLPADVVGFIANGDLIYIILNELFSINGSLLFFTLLTTNKIFRKDFFILIRTYDERKHPAQ